MVEELMWDVACKILGVPDALMTGIMSLSRHCHVG